MALNSIGLGFVFTAKNFASTTIQKLNRDFKGLDRTVDKAAAKIRNSIQHKLLTGLGLATSGAAGLKAGFAAAGDFGDFEQKMARVYAVSSATSEQMGKLKESVIQAGIETQFDPAEAAQGMNELVTRGLNVHQAMEALTPALNLAAAGEMSIAQAGTTTAAALKVFGLQAENAGDAANKLLKIETLTALKSKDLEIALGTVGRGASLTGQSLKETLTMLGLVRNTGLETSASATAVSTSLLMMAKNSAKLKDQLGVEVTDAATGEFRDMGDIVLEVGDRLKRDFPDAAERARKATELFNMRGLSGFAAVYRQLESGIEDTNGNILYGADALKFLRGQMSETGDVVGDFKKKLLEGFKGQVELLEGVGKTFMLSIGEPFAHVLKPVLTTTREFLKVVIQAIQSLPMSFKKFAAATLMVASAMTLFAGAALVAVAAMQGMKLASPAVIAAFQPILPYLLPVVAVLTAVTLGFFAVKNAIAFFPGVSGMFQKVRDKVALLAAAMKQVFQTGRLSGDVLRQMLDESNAGVYRFFQILVGLKSRVEGFFRGLILGFKYTTANMGPTLMLIKAAALGVLRALFLMFGVVQDAGPGVDTFTSAGTKLGQVLGNIIHLITIALPFYVAYKTVTIAMAAWTMALAVATGVVTTAKKAYAAVEFAVWFWSMLVTEWTGKQTKATQLQTLWTNKSRIATIAKTAAEKLAAIGLGIATLAQEAWAVATGASTLAAGGLTTAMSLLAASVWAVLGPVLLVVGAFAATYYLTKWLLEITGITDALVDLLMTLTGVNEEQAKFEKMHGGKETSERRSARDVRNADGSLKAGFVMTPNPNLAAPAAKSGSAAIAADMQRLEAKGSLTQESAEAQFAKLLAAHSQDTNTQNLTINNQLKLGERELAKSVTKVMKNMNSGTYGAALPEGIPGL